MNNKISLLHAPLVNDAINADVGIALSDYFGGSNEFRSYDHVEAMANVLKLNVEEMIAEVDRRFEEDLVKRANGGK